MAKPRQFSWQFRLLSAVIAGVGLTLLWTAHTLEPDARGYGTHEQLGLTPCFFQELTGRVCAMCGGTTAWSHLVRGQLLQAVQANLGATLLGLAVVIASPGLLFVVACGRWPWREPTLKTLMILASVWLGVVGLDWIRRLVMEL